MRPERSALALGVVAVFFATVALGLGLEEALVRGTHPWWLAETVELVRDVAILGATGLLVLALAYAIWNGGPAIAALLASGPTLVTGLTRIQLVLTNDVVARLLVGSVAATLAVLVTAYRSSDDWRGTALDHDGLLIASTVTVVATVCYLRLRWAPSTRTGALIEPAGIVLVPVIVVLAGCWKRWFSRSPPADSVRQSDAG